MHAKLLKPSVHHASRSRGAVTMLEQSLRQLYLVFRSLERKLYGLGTGEGGGEGGRGERAGKEVSVRLARRTLGEKWYFTPDNPGRKPHPQ